METPHGRLVALELKNFKSYMGEQTIVRPLPRHPTTRSVQRAGQRPKPPTVGKWNIRTSYGARVFAGTIQALHRDRGPERRRQIQPDGRDQLR
eukprot:COSAG04_NODE_11520_length_703_cov_1.700826_1_plen_92_part_10